MKDLEVSAFQLILHSGNARSSAYEALESIKHLRKQVGLDKMKEAKTELVIAQKEHAQLLRRFANEETIQVNLLLVHAEDHISSTQVCVELIGELIQMYERMEQYEK